MSWQNDMAILQYHAALVGDADRVDRYRDAIHTVVRPGDVVVDIGTGTGVLAYFACQAGAARVYAIEQGPVVALARELAQLNGFGDRIEFIHDRSYRVELPEPADVLITETLWNFGIGEGMIGFLDDARRRFLKPGARILPAGVDLHVVPVQADGLYAQLSGRPADRHGLDLSPIRHYQVNNVHMPHLDADGFLARPELLISTDLDESATPDFDAQVDVEVTQAGVLHGVCGWFRARLAPGVVLSTEPPSTRSSWAHAFFPVQNPVGVKPRDELAIRIRTAADGTVWRWRVEHRRGGRTLASYDQTSSAGFPRARVASGGAAGAAEPPKTNLRGEVVAWVLEAMDGTRSVTQLENEAVARFGTRFADPEDAWEIVRSTVEMLGR